MPKRVFIDHDDALTGIDKEILETAVRLFAKELLASLGYLNGANK